MSLSYFKNVENKINNKEKTPGLKKKCRVPYCKEGTGKRGDPTKETSFVVGSGNSLGPPVKPRPCARTVKRRVGPERQRT